jgi:ribosomal protein L44E
MSFGSTSRVQDRGERRGAGNLGKYSKPTKPKMIGKKLTKKTDFRYECSECKKQHEQSDGIRAKKVEIR